MCNLSGRSNRSSFWIDQRVSQCLIAGRFKRPEPMTNRDDWSASEVVAVYGQQHVELVFHALTGAGWWAVARLTTGSTASSRCMRSTACCGCRCCTSWTGTGGLAASDAGTAVRGTTPSPAIRSAVPIRPAGDPPCVANGRVEPVAGAAASRGGTAGRLFPDPAPPDARQHARIPAQPLATQDPSATQPFTSHKQPLTRVRLKLTSLSR